MTLMEKATNLAYSDINSPEGTFKNKINRSHKVSFFGFHKAKHSLKWNFLKFHSLKWNFRKAGLA